MQRCPIMIDNEQTRFINEIFSRCNRESSVTISKASIIRIAIDLLRTQKYDLKGIKTEKDLRERIFSQFRQDAKSVRGYL